MVWEFYSARRADNAQAQPNPAHIALAELEANSATASSSARRMSTTCTSAPARERLIHMHGELDQVPLRAECGRRPSKTTPSIAASMRFGRCPCGAPPAPAHRLLRRNSPRDGSHPARDRSRHVDARRRHFRLRLSCGELRPLGARRTARAPSTSAPNRRSTPPPSPTSWKAPPARFCPTLFDIAAS